MYCTGGIRCERASALLDQMETATSDLKTEGVFMVRCLSAPQRRGPPLRHRLFESTLPSLICGPRRRPRSRSKPRDPKMSLGDALVEEMAGGAGVVRVIGSGRSFPVGAEHRQTACQQASPPPHPEASCSG